MIKNINYLSIEELFSWIEKHLQSVSYKESKHSPRTQYMDVNDFIALIKKECQKEI